ncbi:MAG: class I SAM-dependent methyltransferase [Caldisericia bacterium]|nr:class I SAM-dependent methyltransferase [Caldisericia bacterium]
MKEFYNKDYRRKHKPLIHKESSSAELFNIYSNFQEERINLIRKFLNKKMKLLEIGCSVGMFLFHIKKYVREISGIDYDSKAAQFASKICGCRVSIGDIEETGLKERTFDVICMLQTLEHIKNPLEFLIKVKKYLKPNGIVYIEVPNLCDALVYAYNLPNHYNNFYFHAAHLWYFTAKSLNILMKKAGFKGRVFFTQDYNILNHMHWLNVDAPQPTCIQGLSSPSLSIRDSFPLDKRKKINSFIKKMDKKYKKLLVKLGITSTISFIGKINTTIKI